jgi:tetratricopeptide (TPR) repeat protein
MLRAMSSPLSPPPLPGDRVGRYLLGDVLGVGGMATVYRATTPGGQEVAVKVLHPGMAATEEGQRFRREYSTLRDLRHPGVVRVFDAGEKGDYPWLAMELVPGTDLESLIEQWKQDPPHDRFERVDRIFRSLCSALAYVHGQGFIHRDLKPSNVLVTPEGQAKLTDFGVVKAPSGQFTTQLTVVGALVGTAAFMAPEQITGKPVDGRADLYSLGAVLFMMLTGERPIVADSIAGYLSRHLHEDPPAPSEVDPRVPPHLDRICSRLLRKDPAQRYPSARQVLVALDRDDGEHGSRLHGRDDLLEKILGRMAALQDGRGGVIVLQGAHGIGLTALLRELLRRSREQGLGMALGDGIDPRLFDHLCEQLPALGRQAEAGTVEQQLAVRLTGRPWTLAVDGLDRGDTANVHGMTTLVRQLIAVHGEPLLVLVGVQRCEGPVAGFCTGAATGIEPELIPVPGLSAEATTRLLQDRGVAGVAAAALGPRLARELGGNPRAMREQLDALVESGWLVRAPHGGLRPARELDDLRHAALPLPRSEQDQELARAQELRPELRRVLEALVVMGMPADLPTLAAVCETPAEELEGELRRLVREEMAETEDAGMHSTWALHPARPRELLYSMIESSRRDGLHRRAAATIQQRARRRLAEIAPVVAHHLLSAGDAAAAWPLLIQAARRALRARQPQRTAALLRQAEKIESQATPGLPDDRASALALELSTLQAELAELRGDHHLAATAWRSVLDRARTLRRGPLGMRARAGLGKALGMRGEHGAARPYLERAIGGLGQGDPAWPAVARVLAEVRLAEHDTRGASVLWDQLEALGGDIGQPQLAFEAQAGRALRALSEDDSPAARELLDQAEAGLRQHRSHESLVRVLLLQTELLLAEGRLLSAVEHALEADRLARAEGLTQKAVLALALASLAQDARGSRSVSQKLAIQAAGQLGPSQGTATGHALLTQVTVARALVTVGDGERASAVLGELPDAPVGLVDPVGQGLAVQARLASARDAERTMELAWAAVGREPPLLPHAAARIAVDAALALAATHDSAATEALAEALERTAAPGLELLRLEALWAGHRAGLIAPHHHAAALKAAARTAGNPARFPQRWS